MDNKNIISLPPAPEPYWISSTGTTNYPELKEDIKADVAVVGGGMAGITTAYLLKKEGLKVALVEASRILKGTTGHTTAKITSQHGLIYNKLKNSMGEEMARQYSQANENAIKVIKDIIKSNNIECDFEPQSSYIYTKDDNYIQKIQDETETASSLGIKASYIEETPLPFSIKAAVRFDNQAQFHPRKYLLALAALIPGNGCGIYENTRAVDIDRTQGLAVVTENGSRVIADKIVIASHYPFYNMEGFYFARIYPERAYVLGIRINGKYPGGMYISAEEPGRSLRSQRYDNGELVFVTGEHHKTGQGPEMMEHYQNLMNFAVNTFSVESIPYRWSTQDCMTLDDIPYTGNFASNTPNVYIATGFGKWGMTNSTASAVILKDLITKGESPWQDVYNPSRSTIGASAKNFIVENANVASQLISGKLAPAGNNEEINIDEAKVIAVDGKKTGAYRDPDGMVHMVDTTCTHLGCELRWNNGDRTWDCPCHGSRFTIDGAIVDGPALKKLNIIENPNQSDQT